MFMICLTLQLCHEKASSLTTTHLSTVVQHKLRTDYDIEEVDNAHSFIYQTERQAGLDTRQPAKSRRSTYQLSSSV
jgi:hypothetical protein